MRRAFPGGSSAKPVNPAVVAGCHLLVGGGSAVAVAVVVDVEGDVVHVQPLPGPPSKWRHLLDGAPS